MSLPSWERWALHRIGHGLTPPSGLYFRQFPKRQSADFGRNLSPWKLRLQGSMDYPQVR